MSKAAILAVRIIGDATGAQKAFTTTETAAGGLGTKLKNVGPVAVAGLTAVAGGAAIATKALYGIGSTFDSVTDTIRTGTGATGDALTELTTIAKNVGTKVPESFDQIGQTVADLNTRLGLTGQPLETLTQQVLDAGRVFGESLDITKLGASFQAFKITGEDTTSALDDLGWISQATGVSINNLTTLTADAAPVMQQLGYNFTETAALIGTLDKAGLDSGRVISGLGKSLTTLAKKGEEPRAAFKRVTSDIKALANQGKDAAALDLAGKLFGTKAAPQLVQALQTGALNVDNLTASLGDSEDTISGLAAETQDAAEKWGILKNRALIALEPLGAAVFDGAGKALDWLMTTLDTVDWTPLTNGLSTASEYLSTVGDGLAWAWDAAQEGFQRIIEWIQPFLPALRDVWDKAVDIVKGGAELISTWVGKAIEWITWAWSVAGEPILRHVSTIFDTILSIITPALDTISAIIDTAIALLTGDWAGAWDAAGRVVTGVWDTITAIITGAWDIITSAITTALEVVATIITGAWDDITGFFTTAWDNITTAVSDGTTGVIDWVAGIPDRILTALGDLGDLLFNAGKSIITGLWDGLKNAWEGAKEWIGGIAGWIAQNKGPLSYDRVLLRPAGQAIIDGLVGGLKAAQPDLARTLDDITSQISGISPRADASIDLTSRGQVNGGGTIVINVNGALDPLAVARQIKDLLAHYDRVQKPDWPTTPIIPEF